MPASKGNCYICGAELGKTAMKNHILKEHNGPEDGQDCVLLKIEGAYEKGYWLYVDIPANRTLTVLDSFLRKIWLECCGHMSGFRGAGKSTKLGSLEPGYQFVHEYDYGSTTETLITVIGRIKRPPQKESVRLLSRNVPPEFSCAECGAPAKFICTECQYGPDNPFYCARCARKHEHDDMLLPVVNSPRMGECGYCGELDTFEYVPTAAVQKPKRPKASARTPAKAKAGPGTEAKLLYPEELYNLAFELKKAKLWDKLYEDEVFAFPLDDGQTGYCVMMGMMGEHFALALYMGERGFQSFRNIQQYSGLMSSGANPLRAMEFMLSQRCLQCSFENKDELSPEELASVRAYASPRQIKFRGSNSFPQFKKFLPAKMPQGISNEDGESLTKAVRAALEVNRKLTEAGWTGAQKEALGFSAGLAHDRPYPLLTPDGDSFQWSVGQFPPPSPPEYPRPALRNDLLRERVKRAKKQNTSWVCDLLMLPQPVMDEESGEAYFAYILMLADKRTGEGIPFEMVRDYEENAQELLQALGERMLERGVPRQIIVTDDRTYSFLKNFAGATNIRLVQNEADELLEEIEEGLMEALDGADSWEMEDGGILGMISTLLMTVDEADLLEIPDNIWNELRMAAEDEGAPEEILRRYDELDRKRRGR